MPEEETLAPPEPEKAAPAPEEPKPKATGWESPDKSEPVEKDKATEKSPPPQEKPDAIAPEPPKGIGASFTLAQVVEENKKAATEATQSFLATLGFVNASELQEKLKAIAEAEAEAQAAPEVADPRDARILEIEKELSGYQSQKAANEGLIADLQHQNQVMQENIYITALAGPSGFNFIKTENAVQLIDRESFVKDGSKEDYQKSVSAALKKLAKEQEHLINQVQVPASVGARAKTVTKKQVGFNDVKHLLPPNFAKNGRRV